MSVLAALLVAVGLADLARLEGSDGGSWRRRWIGLAVGLATLVLLGVLGRLSSALDITMLAISALALAGWVVTSARASPTSSGSAQRLESAVALGVLAAGGLVLLSVSGSTSPVHGPLATWLRGIPVHGLGDTPPTRALLVAGAMVVQLSTANIVVRLVLAGVGAIKPTGQPQPSDRLRGGRLLGPMERITILGLGLAGQLTAAGIVVAAKGLIRWPELQARSRSGQGQPGIDEVTEYFLVGSFVSWLVALGCLWLCAGV